MPGTPCDTSFANGSGTFAYAKTPFLSLPANLEWNWLLPAIVFEDFSYILDYQNRLTLQYVKFHILDPAPKQQQDEIKLFLILDLAHLDRAR